MSKNVELPEVPPQQLMRDDNSLMALQRLQKNHKKLQGINQQKIVSKPIVLSTQALSDSFPGLKEHEQNVSSQQPKGLFIVSDSKKSKKHVMTLRNSHNQNRNAMQYKFQQSLDRGFQRKISDTNHIESKQISRISDMIEHHQQIRMFQEKQLSNHKNDMALSPRVVSMDQYHKNQMRDQIRSQSRYGGSIAKPQAISPDAFESSKFQSYTHLQYQFIQPTDRTCQTNPQIIVDRSINNQPFDSYQNIDPIHLRDMHQYQSDGHSKNKEFLHGTIGAYGSDDTTKVYPSITDQSKDVVEAQLEKGENNISTKSQEILHDISVNLTASKLSHQKWKDGSIESEMQQETHPIVTNQFNTRLGSVEGDHQQIQKLQADNLQQTHRNVPQKQQLPQLPPNTSFGHVSITRRSHQRASVGRCLLMRENTNTPLRNSKVLLNLQGNVQDFNQSGDYTQILSSKLKNRPQKYLPELGKSMANGSFRQKSTQMPQSQFQMAAPTSLLRTP